MKSVTTTTDIKYKGTRDDDLSYKTGQIYDIDSIVDAKPAMLQMLVVAAIER